MKTLLRQGSLDHLGRKVTSWSEGKWLVVIILILSAFVHFVWLNYPWEVVFDEVHFGKFVTAYCCTHERFFDIHPPHAKLIIAGAGYVLGYRGQGPSFDHIGENYGAESPFSLRFVPALAGSLLPLVIFGLLRQLGAGRAAAFGGAILVIFDNSLAIQNRIISLDGVLLLSIFGSLGAYLVAEKRLIEKGRYDRKILSFSLLAGVLAGLAAGSKFTGLVAISLLGILVIWRLWRSANWLKARQWFGVGLLILVSASVVYGLGWALHFLILSNPGPGDAWGVPQWDKPIIVSFIRETVSLHKTMLNANYNLSATHPDSSRWWTWPLMKTSIFYWNFNNEGLKDKVGTMYFLGNPVVWWGLSLLFLLVLLNIILMSRVSLTDSSYPVGKRGWLVIIGYFVSLLPLVRIPRALFLYHYLTPLMFSLLAVVLWLDKLRVIKRRSVLKQPPYYFLTMGLVIVVFVVMSPLTYGFIVNAQIHDWLFWLDSWR